MEYLEDTGTVVSVSVGKATIKLDHKHSDSCGSCCACSALIGEQPGVKVDCGPLKQGDRVRVRIPRVNAYLSMLLVFGLPLMLFVAGIWVGHALEGGERLGALSAIGAVVGLVVAFLVAWLVNRALSRKAGKPEAHLLAAGQRAAGGAVDGAT